MSDNNNNPVEPVVKPIVNDIVMLTVTAVLFVLFVIMFVVSLIRYKNSKFSIGNSLIYLITLLLLAKVSYNLYLLKKD